MTLLAFLSRLATSELATKVLVPSISAALVTFFTKAANRIEDKAVNRAALAAKTSEELREASKKLSDASSRR